MSPETYQRVRRLFEETLARPEAERHVYLQEACAGNSRLLEEVTQLLTAHAQADSFLENEPAKPQRIGRYVIQRELGRGAMGIVYEAVDPLIGRRVAVKVIRLDALADRGEAAFLRERLFREARSAGGLFHPGIVVILDVGQDGEVAFIAMECVEGTSLFQVLAKQPKMEPAEASRILQQTAAALDFAHSHGIIHRDIKPANIMLEKGVTVKVADFGIAKITSAQQTSLTGMTMGTPSYMSPEQVDAKPLDGKSDQFSLAVVAYEMLTGGKPFEADSLTSLGYSIVCGPRPSAHAANPRLPREVDDVLSRGLAKLAADRYATCREFTAALDRALSAPVPAAQESTSAIPLVPPPVTVRHKPLSRYVVAALIAAVVLIAGWAGYRWLTRRAPAPPPPAAKPAPPSIARFAADQPTIDAGSQAVLTWEVSGATAVAIAPDVGNVQSAGSIAVKPEGATAYVLSAFNAAGTVSAKVLVDVKPKEIEPAADAHQLYLDGRAKLANNHQSEGMALLHQAADSGSTQAMVAIGMHFMEEGPDRAPDEPQALNWFRKAANAGDREGMLHLAAAYDLGAGVEEDDEQAVLWYRKAADRGSADAAYDLARKYEKGQGVPQDLDKAREFYQRAANLGSKDAKDKLTRLGNH